MNPKAKLLFPLLILIMGIVALVGATTILDPNYVFTTGVVNGTGGYFTGPVTGTTGTFSGALTGTTLDTGQGATEVYLMNQNLRTTDAPTFATINTGQGAAEVYLQNQNLRTTDAPTFATVNTGQGANELYGMDQNVMTSSDVEFNSLTFIELTPIGQETTYYIDRTGPNSRLISGVNRETLANDTAYNVWNWALGNLTATGGKIVFVGEHNIGANQLYVEGGGGYLGYDIIIEGLGRGSSQLRRTGDGNLLHIVTGTNVRIRDCTLRTDNGTVIYGQPSFSNFRELELRCGNSIATGWTGWAIHIINGEQCETNNLIIQSYGEGAVWFHTNATTYKFGNTEIGGQNMWWFYTPGAIGFKLTGNSNKQTENIHVTGRIALLAGPAINLGDNNTGVYMYYAYNNQILNTKVERCAIAYNLKNSRYNLIDLQYRSSTYINGMTVFLMRTGALNNHIMHYAVEYRGGSNIHLINDTVSTLNAPNIYEGFTFGSVTTGEWYANIGSYAAILWMGGDVNSENLYGQNAGVNRAFPNGVNVTSWEHHCARAPSNVHITWNEDVDQDHWTTTDATYIYLWLDGLSSEIYTFDWSCSINLQGIG